MTLSDIGRMLRLASVPRSKTIQRGLAFEINVPSTHYLTIANVVGRLKMKTDNITVGLLENSRVKPGEHVLVKVSGVSDLYTQCGNPHDMHEVRKHAKDMHMLNRSVVVECVSVSLQ